MNKSDKIDTVYLLPELDEMLIKLLEGFSAEDWEKQTLAPEWKVKDVAVHLLDGNLRTLSMLRDGYYGDKPEKIHSYEDLIAFLNRLNADWVLATKRLSPKVIIDLLKVSGKEYCEFLTTLNPDANAEFSVAWAGENESQNWFHIAREYTEKYHHQQQIRLAVGEADVLLKKEFYFPFLDTSFRALPHHYREVNAEEGDVIQVTVTGENGGDWFLYRSKNKWLLVTECKLIPICHIRIAPQIAWRLFTKGISRDEAEPFINNVGNELFGNKIFEILAVMA